MYQRAVAQVSPPMWFSRLFSRVAYTGKVYPPLLLLYICCILKADCTDSGGVGRESNSRGLTCTRSIYMHVCACFLFSGSSKIHLYCDFWRCTVDARPIRKVLDCPKRVRYLHGGCRRHSYCTVVQYICQEPTLHPPPRPAVPSGGRRGGGRNNGSASVRKMEVRDTSQRMREQSDND